MIETFTAWPWTHDRFLDADSAWPEQYVRGSWQDVVRAADEGYLSREDYALLFERTADRAVVLVWKGTLGRMDTPTDDLDERAAAVLDEALRGRADFAGWLGQILGQVAARHGSPEVLTAGRPGSWEAQHVLRLAGG